MMPANVVVCDFFKFDSITSNLHLGCLKILAIIIPIVSLLVFITNTTLRLYACFGIFLGSYTRPC